MIALELPNAAFLLAELAMLPTSDGGRRTPIRSDYHPNCWIGHHTSSGDRAYNDARVYLETVEELASGERAVARFYPLYPEWWAGLEVGSSFAVCEGRRVVGVARVIERLRPPHDRAVSAQLTSVSS